MTTIGNEKTWLPLSKQLINLLPSEAYVKDMCGKYLLANKNYLSRLIRHGLLKSNNENIIGKTDYDIFDSTSADRFRANDQCVIEQAKMIQLEEDITGSDIPNQKILSIKYPFYADNNEIIGIIGQSYEYTEFRYKDISTYLTDKEMQILACKYLGFSSKKMASIMEISNRTVELHWNSIRSKLKIVNRDNLIDLIHYSGWPDLLRQIYQLVLDKQK